MATLTLSPKGARQNAAPVAEVKPSAEICVQDETENSITIAPPAGVGVEGEISSADIRVPRINLVQKSGNLSNEFTPGLFLFEKTVPLAKVGDDVTFVPLRLKKYYQLKVEFGTSQDMPPKFNTMDEVRAFGGSLQYGDEKYCVEMADIMVAIAAPEDPSEEVLQHFPYNNGEANWALAMYTVGSSAYTSLAKRLITDSVGVLRAGLYTGLYNMHSEIRKTAQNSWYVPVAQYAGKNSTPDFFRGLAGL
jgi:hypothetical protein